MKIAPTIEGGLRVNPETPADWHVLRSIALDANSPDADLATRLGIQVSDDKLSSDWQELVVPDLRESFTDEIHHVQASIEAASAFPRNGEYPIWITPEDAFTWYGALNQARLAMEEKYGFGPDPESNPANFAPVRHEALIRARFYGTLQFFILKHALTL